MSKLRKLQLGNMNEKVRFERLTDAVAADGGISKTVSTIKDGVWASISYVGSPSAGSSEEYVDGQMTGKMKIEVICRYFAPLKFLDQIVYEQSEFEIYSIQMIGKKQFYKLRAQLRDDNSDFLPTGISIS